MMIGEREVNDGAAPYVIAELGVNHDGSVERAIELTRRAAAAGADAIKLQLFDADLLMSKAAKLAAYQRSAGERDPIEMLRRLQLSVDEMSSVVAETHLLGIHAIVTVFTTELVEHADRLAWDAYKSASPDIVHRPLLEAMARTSKPLIVSTGAATIDEVTRATQWLADWRERLAVLQCVSSYPTPEHAAALRGIAAIRHATGLPTGYSDHTSAVDTGAIAVAAGACILEKHVTYSRGASGPDHAASLEPEQFGEYVRLARRAHEMLGGAGKEVLDIERDVRSVSRQSVTSVRALPAGHVLQGRDITIKRPGIGVLAYRLSDVIGRSLVRAIDADTPIMEDDLE